MSHKMTWKGEPLPEAPAFGLRGWLRILIKGTTIGVVTFGGLLVLLLLRVVEQPTFGEARPWTPKITQFVCRTALWVLGIQRFQHGALMSGNGALVANHVSWLDIFVLNAAAPVYFVAKSEVRGWPGIGWLARATGTLFVRRDPKEAKEQVAEFGRRLSVGHLLLLFPEGTSTDGQRVLPFRSTLFQPFVDLAEGSLLLQPVSLAYGAPVGEAENFYGWWGDMAFGSSLLRMLAAPRHGHVKVVMHQSIGLSSHYGRKELAKLSETAVRKGLEDALARNE